MKYTSIVLSHIPLMTQEQKYSCGAAVLCSLYTFLVPERTSLLEADVRKICHISSYIGTRVKCMQQAIEQLICPW